MATYRESGGTWYVVDGKNEYVFQSEQEARIFMAKLDTAKAIVQAVQALALPADDSADLEAEYFDVGAWTDADVEALGITAAQLASCLTVLQQVNKLMTGQATTPAMYRSTLNVVRRVQV